MDQMKEHLPAITIVSWLGLALVGCQWIESEGPPSLDRMTSKQVTEFFFEAYLAGDPELAAKVAEPKAIEKLKWDGGAANNPTMMLAGESIVYEGGAIHMIIHQDGHVGARIVDVELIVD